MNYIYDVLVNFSSIGFLEFYEWDKKDDIEHLRRIPIFKINSNKLNDFKYNNVKVSDEFLLKIKNKTELFSNKSISYIEYSCILTDGVDLIVIEFESNGNNILKSSMLLDEANEVLEESELMNETFIEYEVRNTTNNDDVFLTRNQKEIIEYIKNELKCLITNKNYNKLKYLYYEWYNTKINDMDKMIEELYRILSIEFSDKHYKFYDLIKFSNNKKQIKQN